MTYSDQLKDPRWQRKRLEILNRDEWMCKACGSVEKTLHVHHFKYMSGKKAWEYPDTNFITLCCDCHEEEEQFVKNQHKGFIKLNRMTDFPIRKMWHISFIMCFLYKYDYESYATMVQLFNHLIDCKQDVYNDFWDQYHE